LLGQIGCGANAFVIHGLLSSNLGERFGADSARPSELAATFLDETKCSGAHGLSQEDKIKLQEMRDRRPPVPPVAAPATQRQ
jgi:hypothetical protein